MDEKNTRQLIVEACQRLYQRNMLAAADGNISAKLDDGRILITPSGVAKAFMKAEEMAVLAPITSQGGGEALQGRPSTEIWMHLDVFRHCPKARWVIHAHPPAAIAWSVARPHLTELPFQGMPEVILAVKKIPIIPYARPGTPAMGQNLHQALPHSRAMILARHGALSWGEDFQEAINGMERLEHAAQIILYAEQLGGVTSLPADELEALLQLREKAGERSL